MLGLGLDSDEARSPMRLLLVLFVVSMAEIGVTGPLRLELVAEDSQLLTKEPYVFHLSLVNTSKGEVRIARLLGDWTIWIQANGRWHRCESGARGISGERFPSWESIGPGSSLSLPYPQGWSCLCREIGSGRREWNEVEGKHRIKMSWDHHEKKASPLSKEAPSESERSATATTFNGTLESNILEVIILAPVGEDALALQWADEHMTAPFAGEVFLRYPHSRYAAHFVFQHATAHPLASPAHVVHEIEARRFPPAHPVPMMGEDGRTEYRSLAGEDLATWYVRTIQEVLSEHDDIWFADQLRLRLALSMLATGSADLAEEQLRLLVSDGSVAPGDAEQYLSILAERGIIPTEPVSSSAPPATAPKQEPKKPLQ